MKTAHIGVLPVLILVFLMLAPFNALAQQTNSYSSPQTTYTISDSASCHSLPSSANSSWNQDNNTCVIYGTLTISFGDVLTVSNSNLSIGSDGKIYNLGTINNSGALYNQGEINNSQGGTIINSDTIFNSDGFIENDGTINNTGTINNNDGRIDSKGSINNDGTINNSDNFNNIGVIDNKGDINNPPASNSIAGNNNPGNSYHVFFENVGTINNIGTINNNSGGDFDNRGGTVVNSGTFNTIAGSLLDNFFGTINNNPSGTITNGGILRDLDNSVTNNFGTIANLGIINTYYDVINDQSNYPYQSQPQYNGAIVINNNKIDNEATITNKGTIFNNCTGTITNNPPATISNPGVFKRGGPFNNLGTFSGNSIILFECNPPSTTNQQGSGMPIEPITPQDLGHGTSSSSGITCPYGDTFDPNQDQCVPQNQPTPTTPSPPSGTSTQQSYLIPGWVKNNAKWWSQGQTTDSDFALGIGYLVSNGIIKTNTQGLEGLTSGVSANLQIPSWIKNSAGWWADGSITDFDFLKGIQYMLDNNIITFSTPKTNNQQSNQNNPQATSQEQPTGAQGPVTPPPPQDPNAKQDLGAKVKQTDTTYGAVAVSVIVLNDDVGTLTPPDFYIKWAVGSNLQILHPNKYGNFILGGIDQFSGQDYTIQGMTQEGYYPPKYYDQCTGTFTSGTIEYCTVYYDDIPIPNPLATPIPSINLPSSLSGFKPTVHTYTIDLKILDATTGLPVDALVTITANSQPVTQETDRDGIVHFIASGGDYEVQVDSQDYQRLTENLAVIGNETETYELEPIQTETSSESSTSQSSSQTQTPSSTQSTTQTQLQITATPTTASFVHNIGQTQCPEPITTVNLSSNLQGSWSLTSYPSWASVSLQGNTASIVFNCQLSEYATQTLSGNAVFQFTSSDGQTKSVTVSVSGQVNGS